MKTAKDVADCAKRDMGVLMTEKYRQLLEDRIDLVIAKALNRKSKFDYVFGIAVGLSIHTVVKHLPDILEFIKSL